MFHNFIQGDLSVSDYCRKMKNMADLSCAIFDRNLILNVLRGRNMWYGHLRTIIMHNMPFPSFHKIRDDLVLEELTLDPDIPRLLHRCSTPTIPLPHLPLLRLIPLAIAARVMDMVVTATAVSRTVEAMAAAVVMTATLLARAASLALPRPLGPPSTTLGQGPSTCTTVQLWGGGAVETPPSIAASSHCCAWSYHGQPSVHTALGTDLDSTADVHRPAATGYFSILGALAWLVGSATTCQLLQHDDALDAALTYGVG
jgi:hypothetical protein